MIFVQQYTIVVKPHHDLNLRFSQFRVFKASVIRYAALELGYRQ